jgi:hypothetical protein
MSSVRIEQVPSSASETDAAEFSCIMHYWLPWRPEQFPGINLITVAFVPQALQTQSLVEREAFRGSA